MSCAGAVRVEPGKVPCPAGCGKLVGIRYGKVCAHNDDRRPTGKRLCTASGNPVALDPQVGDRVQVALTGTVVVRHDGKYPSVQIELDDDVISVGSVCDEDGCDDWESCSHARRERVTAFDNPADVVVIERVAGP